MTITRPINEFALNLLIANKSQKPANIGVIWPVGIFYCFHAQEKLKKYSRGKYNSCSRILQISPREETTIFTMLFFSIADVNARKNFACINFVASVDSYRQVKLSFVCIVVFFGFFFSLLCINKPARSVAQNNSKAKYGQAHF